MLHLADLKEANWAWLSACTPLNHTNNTAIARMERLPKQLPGVPASVVRLDRGSITEAQELGSLQT